MKDFGKRLPLALFSIGAVVALLVFALLPQMKWVVALIVSVLAVVAVWEYGELSKAKGAKIGTEILLAGTFLEVFSFFLSSLYPFLKGLSLCVFAFVVLLLFFSHFKETEGAILDLSTAVFGLIYVAVPMGMLLSILYVPKGQDGRIWVAYLLVLTKIGDMGAYFVGNLWGKQKLAPTISPSKTVEGSVFGLLCTLGASFLFYSIGHYMNLSSFSLSLSGSLGLGLILGLAGPLGDLSESLLKRDAKRKDSNALPGLGGILDMVDSLLFTAPILYLYLYFQGIL